MLKLIVGSTTGDKLIIMWRYLIKSFMIDDMIIDACGTRWNQCSSHRSSHGSDGIAMSCGKTGGAQKSE